LLGKRQRKEDKKGVRNKAVKKDKKDKKDTKGAAVAETLDVGSSDSQADRPQDSKARSFLKQCTNKIKEVQKHLSSINSANTEIHSIADVDEARILNHIKSFEGRYQKADKENFNSCKRKMVGLTKQCRALYGLLRDVKTFKGKCHADMTQEVRAQVRASFEAFEKSLEEVKPPKHKLLLLSQRPSHFPHSHIGQHMCFAASLSPRVVL